MRNIFKTIISNPLEQLDCSTGKVFRVTFFYILKAAAIVVAILGLYLIISGFFGKTGYFATLRGSFSGFELFRSIVCFIITLFLNLFMFFIVSGVLWKRANDFRNRDFSSVLFVFPKLIKIMGEAICVLPAIASTISFVAIALAAIPYAPVEGLISMTGGVSTALINNFIGNTFSAIFVQSFHDYISLLLNGGLLGLFKGFALSFLILLGTYFVAEFFEIFIAFFMRDRATK
jgi:uncharacterized membrane protein